MRMLLAALAVSLLAVPAQASPTQNQNQPQNQHSDTIATDRGPVRGTVTATHRTFQGIPFAAPPVGELRWRSPQAAPAWTAPRDATKPGPRCAQMAFLGSPGGGQEDCLYLNVVTPTNARNRPVMVWIHGGGFQTGEGAEYDARKFAEKTGTVVVTVNYRLGALGFFGYPGLEGSGEFGMQDQQAALKWVQRNAKAFGGNPRNVTVFGESAGAMSICAQLTSPTAAGLFDKAISQSGACDTAFHFGGGVFRTIFAPVTEVQQSGKNLDLGCADLECLRRVDVGKLVTQDVAWLFGRPAYNTRTLPHDPPAAVRDGKLHRVPVLMGTTRDEGTLFTVIDHPEPVAPQRYEEVLRGLYGDRTHEIMRRYPLDGDADARPELAAVTTDQGWACPTRTTEQNLAKWTRVYRFEFADRDAPGTFPGLPPFAYGAYHAGELQYLFDFPTELTTAQQRLADYMTTSWGRFATTGTPGWQRGIVQSLAPDKVRPVDFAAEHQCGFWRG